METLVIFLGGVFIGLTLGMAIVGRIWQRHEEKKLNAGLKNNRAFSKKYI